MKVKQFIIIAALLLAVIAPMKGQELVKVNDTTWLTTYQTKDYTVNEYHYPVDINKIVADNNNAIDAAGRCFIGGMVCTEISGGFGLMYMRSGANFLLGTTLAFGAAATALNIVGCCKMIRGKVTLTPDGIIVKIGKTEKQKDRKRTK